MTRGRRKPWILHGKRADTWGAPKRPEPGCARVGLRPGAAALRCPIDLEFHQLDVRYEELRSPARERRLFSSLAEVGRQAPVVVVSPASSERPVVIDGYKRVRLLRRLGQDAVRTTAWALGEADALLLERMLRAGDADNALDLGWFLRELRERFGRTRSWVSRRLSLIAELPESVQARVRAGTLGAHPAMKCLAPLARANRADDYCRPV